MIKGIMNAKNGFRHFDSFRPLRLITSATTRATSGEPAAVTPEYDDWMKKHEHSHRHREALLVLSGTYAYRLAGRTFMLETSDAVLFDSTEPHTYGNYPGSDAVSLWFFFMPEAVNTVIYHKNSIVMKKLICFNTLNDIFFDVWRDYRRTPAESDIPARELLDILSVMSDEFFRGGADGEVSGPELRSHQEKTMREVMLYIDSLDSLDCDLNSLSTLSGYSRIHFQRLFRKYTGMTIRNYILHKRIERHKARSKHPEISKKELAYELGFSSASALIHWEKENFRHINSFPADSEENS